MFETSVLELRGGRRFRWIVAGSVVVQAGLIAWLVLIPLLWPSVLPPMIVRAEVKHLTFRPVKIVQRVVATQSAAIHPPAGATTAAPVAAPRGPVIARPTPGALNDEPTLVANGTGMGDATGANLFRIPGGTGDGSGPKVSVKASGGGAALKISSGVSSGLLLAPIRPLYPPIAKAAGVSGTVIVAARIGTDGRILGAQVVSGPVMLQAAALAAIRDARYRPYQLNGQPVEVETSFSVNFVMGS